MSQPYEFIVFTKPWKMPLPELAGFVRGLGFDGVELPVRAGYQVEPENVARDLPKAARQLGEYGLKIASVAVPMDEPAAVIDEPTIAACAEAGVALIRICIRIPPERGYLEYEAAIQRQLDALVPLLDRHGVAIGVQNHNGRFVANAMQLRHLIEQFDPKHVAAVWDPAHCALDGEIPELAIDIVWSHLRLVNLKNAYRRRINGPEAELAEYAVYWTSGRQGLASWPTVATLLKQRGYRGDICLTAEYTDEAATNRLIAEDLAFARSLFL